MTREAKAATRRSRTDERTIAEAKHKERCRTKSPCRPSRRSLWSRTVPGREGIFLITCEETASTRAARGGGGETVELGDTSP